MLKVTGCHAFAFVTWVSFFHSGSLRAGVKAGGCGETAVGSLGCGIDVFALGLAEINEWWSRLYFRFTIIHAIPSVVSIELASISPLDILLPVHFTLLTRRIETSRGVHCPYLRTVLTSPRRPRSQEWDETSCRAASIVQHKSPRWVTRIPPPRTPQKAGLCLRGWSSGQTESHVRFARLSGTGNHLERPMSGRPSPLGPLLPPR